MRHTLLQTLLFLTAVALSFFIGLDEARAQFVGNPLAVSGLQINNLSQFKGQYLTVYYTNSHAAGIGLDPDHVQIVRAYIVLRNIPIKADSLTLTPQSITWIGVEKPNLLVLVVHSNPDYLWLNGDLSVPELPGGMEPEGHNDHTAVSTLSIRSINRLPKINDHPSFEFGSSAPSGVIMAPIRLLKNTLIK